MSTRKSIYPINIVTEIIFLAKIAYKAKQQGMHYKKIDRGEDVK